MAGAGVDEDGDSSEWSDWSGKRDKLVKRMHTSHRRIAQSTHATRSFSEQGEKEDSEGEEQIRRPALDSLKARPQSPELGEPRLSRTNSDTGNEGHMEGESGTHVDESDRKDTGANLGTQSNVPKSRHSQSITQTKEEVQPPDTTNSDEHTSSPTSVFDTVQGSKPATASSERGTGLKRKRRSTGTKVSHAKEQPARKRTKNSIYSPPTSLPSDDGNIDEDSSGLRAIQGKFNINRPVKKPRVTEDLNVNGQPSVSAWVKPLFSHTSYKHPLFNPSPSKHPPEVLLTNIAAQHAVTGDSASLGTRRSTRKSEHRQNKFPAPAGDTSDTEMAAPRTNPKRVISSPKGKSKALPGYEYSSPPKTMAKGTTRSSARITRQKKKTSFSPESESNDTPSREETRRSRNKNGQATPDFEASDAGSAGETEQSSDSGDYSCNVCNLQFGSKRQLHTHRNNNVLKPKSYECVKCGKEYGSSGLLIRHQGSSGHQKEIFHSRRAGLFSENEILKLDNYRDKFCDDFRIQHHDFHEMMSDAGRRGTTWLWPGITKKAFLDDYFDVLPQRARKSMQRYRERNFTNLEHSEWTKKDDRELMRLVAELKGRWTEIAQRMVRTQDSVTQRYKKKLKYGNEIREGVWEVWEDEALDNAMKDIKKDNEQSVSWTEVSQRMGGTRTAQQCSTHWNRVRSDGRRRSVSRRKSKASRNAKSKEVISASEDEQNEEGHELDNEIEDEVEEVRSQNRESRSTRSKEVVKSDEEELEADSDRSQDGAPVTGSSSPEKTADRSAQESFETSDKMVVDAENHASGLASRIDWDKWNGTDDQLPLKQNTTVDLEVETEIPDSQKGQEIYQSREDTEPMASPSPSKGMPTSSSRKRRNPLHKKTPGKVMALSQVFQATQAPTSALRQSASHLEVPPSSGDRPSPNIGLKLRPDSSQDLLLPGPQTATGSESESEDDNDHDSRMEEVRGHYQQVDHDAEMSDANDAESGTDESDTDADAVKTAVSDDDDLPLPSLRSSENADDQMSESEQPALMPVYRSTDFANDSGDDKDADSIKEEAEEESEIEVDGEGESESGEDDLATEYESAEEGESDDESSREDSHDSMVRKTKKDFMASLDLKSGPQRQGHARSRVKVQNSSDESD